MAACTARYYDLTSPEADSKLRPGFRSENKHKITSSLNTEKTNTIIIIIINNYHYLPINNKTDHSSDMVDGEACDKLNSICDCQRHCTDGSCMTST